MPSWPKIAKCLTNFRIWLRWEESLFNSDTYFCLLLDWNNSLISLVILKLIKLYTYNMGQAYIMYNKYKCTYIQAFSHTWEQNKMVIKCFLKWGIKYLSKYQILSHIRASVSICTRHTHHYSLRINWYWYPVIIHGTSKKWY